MQVARYGGDLGVSTTDATDALVVSAFGHVFAFRDWFDRAGSWFPGFWGGRSFAGAVEVLGRTSREMGQYLGEDLQVGASSTNVYSAIRNLTEDFGVLASLVLFVFLGFLARRLEAGARVQPTAAAVLAVVASWVMWSPITSLFNYNSLIFSAVVFVGLAAWPGKGSDAPSAVQIQIVLANYHCREEIQRCLAGLPNVPEGVELDVVVVENGGEPLPPDFPGRPPGLAVRSLRPASNVGYFGALQIAIEDPDPGARFAFRILSNPDIEFTDPDSSPGWWGWIAPRVGVLAPRVVSGLSGRDQNPYLRRRPSWLRRARWRAVYSSFAAYSLNDRLSRRSLARQGARAGTSAPGAATGSPSHEEIYAPHGSFLVLTEGLVEDLPAAGVIPFLFAEELFLGEHCARRGWTVLHAPELVVRHAEHATTGALPSRHRFRLQREALHAYLRYAGSSPAGK